MAIKKTSKSEQAGKKIRAAHKANETEKAVKRVVTLYLNATNYGDIVKCCGQRNFKQLLPAPHPRISHAELLPQSARARSACASAVRLTARA